MQLTHVAGIGEEVIVYNAGKDRVGCVYIVNIPCMYENYVYV